MRFIILFFAILFSAFNIYAQWQQCPLSGGNITALAVKDSLIFASTANTLYKSEDYGLSWVISDIGLPTNKRINCISAKSNEIYVGVENSGIYKSIDNGAMWTNSSTGLPSLYSPVSIIVRDTDIFITNPSYPAGIYKSSDNGAYWNSVNANLPDSSIMCIAIDSTGIYAGTAHWNGLFKSTDNGQSWFSINNGLPSGITLPQINTIVANNNLVILSANYGGTKIYKSIDYGANWSLSYNLGYNNVMDMVFIDNYIYAGTETGGVYKSSNGITWSQINTGLTSINVMSLAELGQDLFAGTSGGIFLRAKDSTEWIHRSNGISTYSINSLTNIGGKLFAADKNAGVLMTSDHGSNWTTKNNGITGIGAMVLNGNGSTIFVGNINGLFRSIDNGNSWQIINTGLPVTYYPNTIVSSINKIFFGSAVGVFKSSDYGYTWYTSNSGLTSLDIRSLAVNSYGNVYTGVFDVGVFLSPNNGSMWVNISNGFPGISNINCITTIENYIIVGLGNFNPPAVFSSDNGTTWKVGNNGLFGHNVNTIKTIGNRVLAGVNNGLFYTINFGNDWIDMTDNLPLFNVISIGRDDSCVFVGIEGHGIWKRPLSDFAIDLSEIDLQNISLLPIIYPNPANDFLFIKTDINATLEIINIQGQIVDTKSLTEKVNNLDLSNLVSGVYTLRIKTDRGIAIRKLIKQ